MTRYIAGRLLQMIPLLFGITFLVFAIINLIPGSPVTKYQFNPRTRPEDVARIQENLGLNEPWPERYVQWVSHVLRGDLGISLANFTPIRTRIMDALPNTLVLTVTSLLFALILAVPLGVLSAIRRNSFFDQIATILSTAFFAVPTFWLAFLMIILFASKFNEWGWYHFPTTGTHDFRGGGGFFDRAEHLVLPAVSLGVVQLAGWMRYIRGEMLEVIRQDYVRTAQAKGLHTRVVYYSHALRNALLPLVTLIGLSLPDLFAGAFITETIFAWPGLGRLTVDAATSNDYTLIMGTTLMFAGLVLVANLVADVMYAVLDPRIRYS